jgi:hypothetical protein
MTELAKIRLTISFTFEYEVQPGRGGYVNCPTGEDCAAQDRQLIANDPIGYLEYESENIEVMTIQAEVV